MLITVMFHPTCLCAGKRMAETEDPHEDIKRVRVVTRPFERAVFIDCTWNQTRNIIQDERLRGRFLHRFVFIATSSVVFQTYFVQPEVILGPLLLTSSYF